jgi:acetyl-CoA carboxylase biotin carboxyl carrier protein
MTEPTVLPEPLSVGPEPADPEGAPVTDAPAAGPSAADPSAADGAPTRPGVDADASLLALVDRLAAILERSDLVELEVEAGATGLILRKPEAIAAPSAASAPAGPPAAPRAGSIDETGRSGTATDPAARPSVKAPLTGIWYAAPSPGSPPFVAVGREVAAGQVIGLIEAMKLFNEIKSDVSGRVVKVLAESGQLVKAKQPLIEVEPL